MSFKALSWAWEADTETPGRKLVLVGLAQFANEKDECWPSQKTLAERTLQSERTVREHLAWLEEAGFISRTTRLDSGRYDSDKIRLNLARLEAAPREAARCEPAEDFAAGHAGSADGEKPHSPAAKNCSHQRQFSPPNLQENLQMESPTPPKAPQGGSRRERKAFDPSEFDSLIPLDLQTTAFLEAWHGWMLDRRERRQPVTERAAALAFERLAREARTPEAAADWIRNAIEKGWRGIYPPGPAARPAAPNPRGAADAHLTAQLEAREQKGAPRGADAAF